MEEVKQNYQVKVIRFASEDKAQEVLDKLQRLICEYSVAFVSDLYVAAGFSNRTLEDCQYGWKNLDAASIMYSELELAYILCLPTPIFISSEIHKDMVNHPPHYKSKTGLEVIDVIKAFTADLTGIEATDTGNVIKYICRWKSKNGVEDLKKARWYIDHLISNVEGNHEN